MNPLVVSIPEVCQTLGCSRATVFVLLKKGVLERAPRFGRHLRIWRHTVDRALLTPEYRAGVSP